ncbi:MAG TPA: hypothetical protein VK925_08385, partial [Jiangellaceae bacterium]|nr:hypothetical protein [Jiangellaceae bacterium]
VAHSRATAGTIGAFALPADADQPIHLLSNNHVVADSNRGRPGDVVLQPGPADGGRPADDRIGVLDRVIEMRSATANLVDAATLVIDDGVEIDDTYPAGPLAGRADADVGIDGQVEVAGDGSGLFSAGCDSGSLVYDPAAGTAVGLLFAGSERGGPGGRGLAYCNPIGAVLDTLDIRLGLRPEAAAEDGEMAGDVRAAKQELAARLAGDPRVTGVGITRRHGRVRPLPQRRS